MLHFTEEYIEIAKKFQEKFGYGVPTASISMTIDTNELIITLKECIESGNDDLLKKYKVIRDRDKQY